LRAGGVENIDRLQIMNAAGMTQNDRVTVDGLPGLYLRDPLSVSPAIPVLVEVFDALGTRLK
jgi:hypothetical protein